MCIVWYNSLAERSPAAPSGGQSIGRPTQVLRIEERCTGSRMRRHMTCHDIDIKEYDIIVTIIVSISSLFPSQKDLVKMMLIPSCARSLAAIIGLAEVPACYLIFVIYVIYMYVLYMCWLLGERSQELPAGAGPGDGRRRKKRAAPAGQDRSYTQRSIHTYIHTYIHTVHIVNRHLK